MANVTNRMIAERMLRDGTTPDLLHDVDIINAWADLREEAGFKIQGGSMSRGVPILRKPNASRIEKIEGLFLEKFPGHMRERGSNLMKEILR